MPEAYTHLRTARAAAKMARLTPADPDAFAAGANGPDMLFCYRVWRKGANRGVNLPALGGRMHEESTGAFLHSLIEQAKSPLERSYVLGFLCHYATDCTLHPYVAMVTQKGQVYGRRGGHGYFEIALDSTLHQRDTGDAAVPAAEGCPRILGARLATIGALLQQGIRDAYGIEVSREALADAFHHLWYFRRLFVSRWRVKYAFFWLIEPLFGGRGFVTGHISPARLRGTSKKDKKKLPDTWQDPFTGEAHTDGLADLLEQAQRRSAAYMMAAEGYWQGRVRTDQLYDLLGDRSYTTGQPCGAVPAGRPARAARSGRSGRVQQA